ncbi:MAG: GIY-YIG nuclease family protein [Candidatus Omnitrophica bacterium]|nr:GIY-YIG nuclease family protein [Candidatus Omnitrophota bacterium]
MVKKSGNFSVYILECKDGTYYTGYTNDLERRLKEHNDNKRGAKYTRYKRPVKLVWKKEYRYLHFAMSTEYRIKQLNRKQKALLVEGMRLDKVLARKL